VQVRPLNDRFYPLLAGLVLSMGLTTSLRALLLWLLGPTVPDPWGGYLAAFGVGVLLDLLAALCFLLPFAVGLTFLPERVFRTRTHRALLWATFTGLCALEIFLLAVEYYFFEEFDSRFNTVAVDYLVHPREFFVNIWESYPVPTVMIACGLGGLLSLLLFRKWVARAWRTPATLGHRVRDLAAFGALLLLVWAIRPASPPEIAHDRALRQIGANGIITFFQSAWTQDLSYLSFYRSLPRDEAYARARQLVGEQAAVLSPRRDSLERRISGDPQRPKLNVVILLEESLGSAFCGTCRGATQSFTPELDALTHEGILFNKIYATGNRTVRGLEGVLASFPPLPGGAILVRSKSDQVQTLARTLKDDGYSTLFLYGGRGVFDGMRSFALRNGFDRFIEQKDFVSPTHETIWGVCDEDIFHRAIEEYRALDREGRPFFSVALSVSNHKPFTYPKGRIAADPDARKRVHAVMYADWAIGEFFRMARKEPFWDRTVFVVVGDHGARIYGAADIPLHSYAIPFVVLGPAVVSQPRVVSTLGCSLDVAPTILGLIGRPYDSTYFGRDLLGDEPERGRALVHHNRDIGMLRGEEMVVLGLKKSVTYYRVSPTTHEFDEVDPQDVRDQKLLADAEALFTVADDLYTGERYFVSGEARSVLNMQSSSTAVSGAAARGGTNGDVEGKSSPSPSPGNEHRAPRRERRGNGG
jgi:phosphoglycerol transferase MdoB-like AlkP superfamily enzyme